MARSLSPLSAAIRQLCVESNGSITHAEARPQLAKLGIAVAPEPNAPSDDYRAYREAAGKVLKNSNPRDAAMLADSVQAKVQAKLELSAARLKAVQQEIQARAVYFAEANNFNVVKNHWKNSDSPSTKPKVKATGKASVARKAKRGRGRPPGSKNKPKIVLTPATTVKRGRGRPKKDTAPVITLTSSPEVMSRITALGGVSAIQKMIDAENTNQTAAATKATELQGLLASFATLQKEMAAAAA